MPTLHLLQSKPPSYKKVIQFVNASSDLPRFLPGGIVVETLPDPSGDFPKVVFSLPAGVKQQDIKRAAPDLVRWRDRLTEFLKEGGRHEDPIVIEKYCSLKRNGKKPIEIAYKAMKDLASSVKDCYQSADSANKHLAWWYAMHLLHAFGYEHAEGQLILHEAIERLKDGKSEPFGVPYKNKFGSLTYNSEFAPISPQHIRAYILGPKKPVRI